MRRKRKYFALFAACSLAVTTVLPGTAYAAPSGADAGAPQITDVRVLKERNYLEIRWDQEVQNSVDPDNYILKNGDNEFELLTGNWNTMYFDGYALSSIGFNGTVDESEPVTLEIIEGNTIQDADGNKAEPDTYTVDYENYYTQFYTSETGIVVKASDNVQYDSLIEAAEQIDLMLGKTETGIAAQMADYGASMALYGPDENAYFIPEHRNAWDPNMYEVEGYGGSEYNGGVSSIAEKNVIRVLEGENQTGYRNENILVHEFGHSVKLLGMDLLEDQSLHDEFISLYNSRKALGMWPNTYAISNEDEFFATMCTIWFSVMEESPDWTDGTRGPINTREDLLKYDPETYAFFEKIFPAEYLDDPWDPSTIPNNYDDVFVPAATGGDTHNYNTDSFKILYGTGNEGETEYHLEQYSGVVLWWNYGDEAINSWKLTRTENGFHITTLDGSQALAPTDGSTVSLAAADISDPAQLWDYIPAGTGTGKLINASDSRALGLASSPTDGTTLQLVDEADAPVWRINNLTRGTALFPKESHDFAGTYFRIISAADGKSVWENWDNGVIWDTVDSDRNSWKITPAGDGYFRISPLENPDMVMAPQDGSIYLGTRIILTAENKEDNSQLWTLESADGYVRFINKASGLTVGVANDDMTSGNTLVLTGKADSSYQKWTVVNKTTSAALEQPDIPNYTGIEDEPSEPEDPDDPAGPTDPEDPDDPAGPTDPEDPDDPAGPTDPEDPDDPTGPTDPEDPDDPAGPTDPEDPDNPAGPADPEDPDDPAGPADPEDPDDPAGPADPDDPDDPDDPAGPEDPADPEKPGDPAGTSGTDKPDTPVYTGGAVKTGDNANPAAIAAVMTASAAAALCLTARRNRRR